MARARRDLYEALRACCRAAPARPRRGRRAGAAGARRGGGRPRGRSDEAAAHRRARPPQRRQVDAAQPHSWRGSPADRPGAGPYARQHRPRSRLARPQAETVRHRRACAASSASSKNSKSSPSPTRCARCKFAEVVILLLDATIPFEKQDLTLADLAEREGRAVVIGLNKWDLIENKSLMAQQLRAEADRLLPQLRGVRVIPRFGPDRRASRQADGSRDRRPTRSGTRRISTGRLNRWLAPVIEATPPPAVSGRRVKIRYMTQPKSRPPFFVLFGNQRRRDPRELQALPRQWVARDFRSDRRADPALDARRLAEPLRAQGPQGIDRLSLYRGPRVADFETRTRRIRKSERVIA